jgi:hypothetical protein
MHKNLTHISVILLLLISTIGMPISNHYCGSKLVSVSISNKVDHCSNRMKKCRHCCKDISHFYKIQNEYVTGEIAHINPIFSLSFLSDLFFLHSSMIGLQRNAYGITTLYAPYLLPCHRYIFISSGGNHAPPLLAYFSC